jgi:predicted nucleic acid-binding Zn ribbon protein
MKYKECLDILPENIRKRVREQEKILFFILGNLNLMLWYSIFDKIK